MSSDAHPDPSELHPSPSTVLPSFNELLSSIGQPPNHTIPVHLPPQPSTSPPTPPHQPHINQRNHVHSHRYTMSESHTRSPPPYDRSNRPRSSTTPSIPRRTTSLSNLSGVPYHKRRTSACERYEDRVRAIREDEMYTKGVVGIPATAGATPKSDHQSSPSLSHSRNSSITSRTSTSSLHPRSPVQISTQINPHHHTRKHSRTVSNPTHSPLSAHSPLLPTFDTATKHCVGSEKDEYTAESKGMDAGQESVRIPRLPEF